MPPERNEEEMMSGIAKRNLIVLAVGVALSLGLAVGSWGQASFAISDFEPVGYMMKLDGQTLEKAEVFQSKAAGAFLILAPNLPAPVMVKVRDAQVQTLDLMKVSRQENGTVELLPNATLSNQGAFRVTTDRTGIEFNVDGRQGELREKPPLLGSQNIDDLTTHSPEYRRSADSYAPSDPIVDKLKEQSEDVQVTVVVGIEGEPRQPIDLRPVAVRNPTVSDPRETVVLGAHEKLSIDRVAGDDVEFDGRPPQ